MKRAIFQGTNINGADMHSANIAGADFTGARLEATKLKVVGFTNAIWTDGTTCITRNCGGKSFSG